MKKRWLMCLTSIMVAGTLLFGCGQKEEKEKEEKPETEETGTVIQPEEEEPRVTPVIVKETLTSEKTEDTEASKSGKSEEKDTSQNQEKKDPVISKPSQGNESTENSSSQEEPSKSEEKKEEQFSKTEVQGVPAAVILYEGTYFAEEVYKMAAELGDGIYCEIDVSNITDTSFDFTVYEVNELEETRNMIFKTHTAVFQGDGTTAVYNGKEYTLNFTFPDYHTSLPHVTDMEVTGFAPLEGETYMNNSVPGYEFG